jgi:ketosteroid isomerase-like protein
MIGDDLKTRLATAAMLLITVFIQPRAIGAEAVNATDRFRTLEVNWGDAIKRQDRAAIERFLAPDYSLTIAVSGRLSVIDRESWLKAATSTYVVHSFSIESIVVRDYSSVAVVSSLYRQSATVDGSDRSGEFFLTDVWVKTGDEWRVSARYSIRAEQHGSGTPQPVPAAPQPTPRQEGN